MPHTVMEVLKTLPRTNCGECGQATCLAFATQVINALDALQEKVAPLDLASVAPGIGARYDEEIGRPFLRLSYFGHNLQVFKDEVRYPEGIEANPWDAILLYNYMASQGQTEPTGTWITFQSLPNSVSKTKTLKRLEGELAAHFAGKQSQLEETAARLGAEPVQTAGDADLQLVFHPLPRVPVLMLFWEADQEEDFPAQVHLLFDGNVSDYLDLESLLFLVEQLADRLMA
ncbi:MAG: DUF3786 domain-containing protein [Syntrophobacterales bacterium]